ncbi:hypothetical protein D5086_031711 [Populus alba]|uniref:Uncharacterized protein n=1 Tax=Populus alba TaxID=43335 RepID=A0ACC4AJC1_POPAL
MEQNPQPQWEGKVSARLAKATADQIWPLLNDFFNLHKWFPGLAACYGIHGTNGEPGCIRHCEGSSIPSTDTNTDGHSQPVSWSTERLTAVDHGQRDDGQDGCVIEWSFSVDPVAGLVLDELVRMYKVGLQQMAERLEDGVEGLRKLYFLFSFYMFAAALDYFYSL